MHLELSRNFPIDVAHFFSVKDSDKPAIHQILEGKDLKVVCNATEEIETEIYWWKNDTKAPFREEGNTLSFQNIRRNATGEYICYSENTTVVEVIKVDVLCKTCFTSNYLFWFC